MNSAIDVAIVGAGPAGAATAIRLARAGLTVALLERSRFDAAVDKPRVGESLAPGVQPLLSELGAWPAFQALKPLPSYGTRSVWGAAEAAQHSHLLTPYLSGWHVDRMAFDRMLAMQAAAVGARLRLGARVSGCIADGKGGFTLSFSEKYAKGEECEQERTLRANFIIDATGRGSSLAREFNAHHIVFDRLVGVAAQSRDSEAGSHCYTLVETTADGWWYSAPVTRERSIAMLMTDGDLARSHSQADFAAWHAALQRAAHTRKRLGVVDLHWGPRIVSAVSQRLLRTEQTRRWLAVGDAALAVDPISGSGVVRALRTAAAAAETVLSCLGFDGDGDGDGDGDNAIARYEEARNNECSQYLVERMGYYAAEQRWSDSIFWQRRLDVLQRFDAEINPEIHSSTTALA